jgi:hypothetical protein
MIYIHMQVILKTHETINVDLSETGSPYGGSYKITYIM